MNIVDSNENTLSSYLLSGELPPLSFFKKEHEIEVNKIINKQKLDSICKAYFSEFYDWMCNDDGTGNWKEKHKELEDKYGVTGEMIDKFLNDSLNEILDKKL